MYKYFALLKSPRAAWEKVWDHEMSATVLEALFFVELLKH
jgi:hypothetical protein